MKHFAAITAQYVDKPFRRFSCMEFLYAIYTDLGVVVPDSFGELNLSNYMNAFKKDSYGTQIDLLRLVRTLGKPVPANRLKVTDLLVVAQNITRRGVIKPGFLPAIYCGKGQALASFLKTGVSAFSLDGNNRPIAARRMI